MALVLEDGTVVAGANSGLSVADADAYHLARGNTAWTSVSSSPDQGKSAALIRGTAAIDAKYRARFPGAKVGGRDQGIQWPRTGAYDADGNEIASDEIPQEYKDAIAEAALRELVEPGSMMPDLERGGDIRSLKAGSVAIEYGGAAPATTTFSIIDGILAPLLGSAQASFVASSVRA